MTVEPLPFEEPEPVFWPCDDGTRLDVKGDRQLPRPRAVPVPGWPRAGLQVRPCTFDAAKYATQHWHYSHRLPRGKTVKYGVWENGRFVGAIVYGSGANSTLGAPYGLQQTEVCELIRVALRDHQAPVTQIVAATLRQLRASQPGLRLVVSYADPEQGHHGGVYQAGNWIHNGDSDPNEEYVVNGRRFHGKTLRQERRRHPLGAVEAVNVIEWARKVLDPAAAVVKVRSKHRYLMPLDRPMRRLVEAQRKHPPCRYADGAAQTSREYVPGDRPGQAGSVPARRSPRIMGAGSLVDVKVGAGR